MRTTTLSQTITLPATPVRVYRALLSSRDHSAFTGDTAHMSVRMGGKFSAFSGFISGRNLELRPGKIIIQEWRAEEKHWPKDHFSVATFALKPIGSGTLLRFSQTGVPIQHAKSIADGWKIYYWGPMKRFFTESRAQKTRSNRPRATS